MNRETAINAINANTQIDVLVIGGGVNGIGTFRELALQGLRVLLVEKGDFCSGASAGSSHMLHGGIRYLENGEFRLVREALHERNLLLKNAPHYAKPLPTTIPIFRWFSGLFNAPLKFLGVLDKPSERGAIVIKLGLMMYDWFTGPQQQMPFHTVSLKSKSLKQRPKLNHNIVCTATYYDAYMPYPERLCIDLLHDVTSATNQAWALNYAEVTDGNATGVHIVDKITGATMTVQPKVVINAAGPWIDFVNNALGETTKFIGGTKGSHIVLDHPELYDATGGSEIFFESEDGRIVLIFPYMGKVMIGTTDIRIDNPEQAECTEEEVDYMLKLVERVFPTISVNRSQIIFRFTGVRPLPATADSRTGAISRDHSIRTIPASTQLPFIIHSLIGGKWTTFRAFSEQAANRTLQDLGKPRLVDTTNMPIGGGRNFPTTESERAKWISNLHHATGISPTHIAMLLDRYGTRAKEMIHFISEGNDRPIEGLPHYTERELVYLAQREAFGHLDDFFLRRSLVAMLGQANRVNITDSAKVIGGVLGWSAERIQTEIENTITRLQNQHFMSI